MQQYILLFNFVFLFSRIHSKTKMEYMMDQELLQRDVIIIHRVMLNSFQYLRWMMSHA